MRVHNTTETGLETSDPSQQHADLRFFFFAGRGRLPVART